LNNKLQKYKHMKKSFQTIFIIIVGLSGLYCQAQVIVQTPVALQEQIKNNLVILDSVIYYIDNNNITAAKTIIARLNKNEKNYEAFYIAGASEMKGKYDQIIDALNKKIEEKDKTIESQNKTIEASKKTSQKEIVAFIEDFLHKRDLNIEQIIQLTKAKENLEEAVIEKDKEILTLNAVIIKQKDSLNIEVRNWKEKFSNIKTAKDSISAKLQKYQTAVQFGLSLGFNYYFNNQLDYFVRADSTIREAGSRTGACGMISSVVSIRISEKDNIVINIPLGDFTSDANRAVGLFNKRVGLGLGYARRLSDISPNLLITGIFNISPYPKIDYNEIISKKFNLPEYTKLKADDYGATTNYSYSITIGIVWNFINTK